MGKAIANHRIDGQIDVDFGHTFVVVFVVDWPTWRQIERRQWRKDMKKEKRQGNVQGPKCGDVWEEDNNSRIGMGKKWWRNWTMLKTAKNSTDVFYFVEEKHVYSSRRVVDVFCLVKIVYVPLS